MTEETQETQPQTTMIDGDMLTALLTTASERAAKREAEEALKKGFVTREQINAALGELSTNLETNISQKVGASLQDLVETAVKNAITVDKNGAVRKGTLLGGQSLDEREADPVAYLIRKGKEQGPESFDEVDKRIIWAMTFKALSTGMIEDQREED